jgi:hypothetical protein
MGGWLGAKLHGEKTNGNDYETKREFQEAYDLKSYGILRIELRPRGHTWTFIPTQDNKPRWSSKKTSRLTSAIGPQFDRLSLPQT